MSTTWLIIRASGIVAYGLLALSVIWGLALSSTLLGRRVPARVLTYVHESLSIGALVATTGHCVALALDDYVPFGPRELLVPGASAWRTGAVAFGVVAAWGLVVVTLSFYVRRHIGRAVWRAVHYGGFGVFVAALTHGLTAGTDSASPVMHWVYVSTAAAVAALVVARVVLVGVPLPKRAAGRAG